MESYIQISFLNDFVFCPRSVYFHQLYRSYDESTYQQKFQIAGKAAHSSIDTQKYSNRKNILQGMEVYCEQYRLCGKIDIFNIHSGELIERKNKIDKIYDGYIFQTYAQYYSLIEMGYTVKSILLYDITHNRKHQIDMPWQNKKMNNKFEKLISDINCFNLNDTNFNAVKTKCNNCIYSNLCDYSLC